MGPILFRAACARAWTETRADVRLDKPVRIVLALIAPAISALIVWSVTGSVSWTTVAGIGVFASIVAILFLTKLVTVPLAMANEASAAHLRLTAEFGDKIHALEQQLTALSVSTASPPRDPDGIYQHARLVGKAIGVRPVPNIGMLSFDQINDQGEFHGKSRFEYRDYILETKMSERETSATFSGAIHHSYYGLQAKIIGRL